VVHLRISIGNWNSGNWLIRNWDNLGVPSYLCERFAEDQMALLRVCYWLSVSDNCAFASRLAEKTYAPQAETLDINGNSNVKIGGGNSIVNFRYSQCASPNVLNVPVGACFDARSLSAEQVATIRSTVKPGAIIYIIPLMPGGLVNFAHDLAVAFSSVPQVKVTIDSSNVIINGSRGLLLQYDHDNSVAKSVFEALQKAGLNPQDLPNISGPIVFLKVAPQ